jgi:hypothetical protein
MALRIASLVWQVTQELVWAAPAVRTIRKRMGMERENVLNSRLTPGPSR